MGKVGSGPYRSSRQGVLDAAGWLNTLDVIATFHYYDPRDFTNQDEDDGIKWLGRPWEVAEIASDFAEVSAALDVPVYVGEFGLNSHIDDDHAIEWLESVRESAVAAGFETAVWHLLDGGEGLTAPRPHRCGGREWDKNPLAAAAVGSSAQGSQGRRLEQGRSASSATAATSTAGAGPAGRALSRRWQRRTRRRRWWGRHRSPSPSTSSPSLPPPPRRRRRRHLRRRPHRRRTAIGVTPSTAECVDAKERGGAASASARAS